MSQTTQMNLNLLPEALVFDICNYLDIFSLVALSDVDTSLRTLATTRSSFWIHTLANCNLTLFLVGEKAIHQYPAHELHLAAHRAVLVERNLSSDRPKLRAWNSIAWPYPLSDGVLETQYSSEETCGDAHATYLVDDEAGWMIFVSSNNILRVVFLRTGRVGLIWDGARFTPEHRHQHQVVIKWAVRYIHVDKTQIVASMVMNCCFQAEEGVVTGIRSVKLVLNLLDSTASLELLGDYKTPRMASYLNLTGDLVVMVIQRSHSSSDKFGDVYMLHWPSKKLVTLPHMYPSLRVALYKEYFVNVGLTPDNQVVAQVVPFSTEDEPEPQQADTSSTTNSQPDCPLPTFNYLIPYTGPTKFSTNRSCRVGHIYTGSQHGVVRLCIRPRKRGNHSIMTFTFDLHKLRTALTKMRRHNVAIKEELEGDPEAYRVLEETNIRHHPAPTSSARRFVWFRQSAPDIDARVEPAPPGDSAIHSHSPDAERPRLRLFTLLVEDLAPSLQILDEAGHSFRTFLDPGREYSPESAYAAQINATRELELPPLLAQSPTDVYVFLLLDSTGTAVVQLRSGELWVLRYGKA